MSDSLFEIYELKRLFLGPISFKIKKFSITSINGDSGAGKTMFLRSIADLDKHTGDLFFNGKSFLEYAPHIWRTKVAYVPSESAWWGEKVSDSFLNITQTAITPALRELNLRENIFNEDIRRLSSGEKQRLALLRSLTNFPTILLLDEPTANLDMKSTLAFEEFVKKYVKTNGAAVLWVSHNMEQSKRVADNFFTLKDGLLFEANIHD